MPDPADKLNPLALRIMRHATVADLRNEAAELTRLVNAVHRPLPVLPTDAVQREAVLMVLLLQARDRERRLLGLLTEN